MSPRPYPTQTRNTDERAARRALQDWLRPPYALDKQEQHRQLDEGSTDNGARVARAHALAEWSQSLGVRYVLTAAQLEQLHRFLEDTGARPAFVWPAAPGRWMSTEEQLARAAAVAEQRDRGPKEDPTEPGRYVQARGHQALAGAEGFEPDSR